MWRMVEMEVDVEIGHSGDWRAYLPDTDVVIGEGRSRFRLVRFFQIRRSAVRYAQRTLRFGRGAS